MFIENAKSIPVSRVMLSLDQFPIIDEHVIFKNAIEAMGQRNLGIVCIVGPEHELLGILTDGDIRRKLLTVQKPFAAFFVDDTLMHAVRSPTTVRSSTKLVDAVQTMQEKQIWDLPVTDGDNKLVGLLHLHPAIQNLLGMNGL